MPVVKIAFLDVGQGDTTVISCPETQEAIVVDCVDSSSVLDYLEKEHIKQLRGVIITHLHADHYGDVADLLNNCADMVGIQGCEVLATTEDVVNPHDLHDSRKKSVSKKYPPDGDGHSYVYEQPQVGTRLSPSSALAKLYLWCKQNERKCEPLKATPHAKLPMEGTLVQSLKLLHPPHVDYQKLRMQGLNNISVVLRVTGNGSSALLTGDLEPYGWQQLKAKSSNLASDILKFPHHGGAWNEAQADDLLSAIQPSIAVIAVGSNNTYDHPKADAFNSLRKRTDIHLLCTQATDQCQSIVHNERSAVVSKFKMQSEKNSAFFIRPGQKQCPCAGTIIIELDDKPRILQPIPSFHEDIIQVHFREHKCYRANLSALSLV
ncbi:MAG TPA: MBL fold metallo-hydrolase [Ktedonobacteraceae bacterium]|nr:MBL fold metallo-hydrolase [Ktedonobacteraceae bacterium]